jgi:hypothetical protein
MSNTTQLHNFKVGDIVTVFNRRFSKFVIEGRAEIVSLRQAEDMYNVRFFRDWFDSHTHKSDGTQIRFVDPNGQEDPEGYLEVLNQEADAARR